MWKCFTFKLGEKTKTSFYRHAGSCVFFSQTFVLKSSKPALRPCLIQHTRRERSTGTSHNASVTILKSVFDTHEEANNCFGTTLLCGQHLWNQSGALWVPTCYICGRLNEYCKRVHYIQHLALNTCRLVPPSWTDQHFFRSFGIKIITLTQMRL